MLTKMEPRLPEPRGPVSMRLLELLADHASHHHLARVEVATGDSEPYGADLQLALYVCYELHYRGFADVDDRWEWNGGLLHLRGRLEDIFLEALQRDVGEIGADDRAIDEMAALSVEAADGQGASYYLRDRGNWQHMREYFVHRSLYHLKEGDPHAWAIPRLIGQAKASFVAVEFDEYGAGRGPRVHQELFAELLAAADLDPSYGNYLDYVPPESLAVVNLMSLFGLHRKLRGAAIGHFAATEISSSPGSRRLVEALCRLRAPQPCVAFYREHIEADAVHEQVVRSDVVGDLVVREPHLDRDVIFGIRAYGLVEDRLSNCLIDAWSADRSSLLLPLI